MAYIETIVSMEYWFENISISGNILWLCASRHIVHVDSDLIDVPEPQKQSHASKNIELYVGMAVMGHCRIIIIFEMFQCQCDTLWILKFWDRVVAQHLWRQTKGKIQHASECYYFMWLDYCSRPPRPPPLPLKWWCTSFVRLLSISVTRCLVF